MQRFIPILVIGFFLFPLVTEDIHQLAHAHDFHCFEKAEKHFHPSGHHCQLCETIFTYDKASLLEPSMNQSRGAYNSFIEVQVHSIPARQNPFHLLRAPPAREA